MKTRATDANIPLWAKTHGYKSPETDELLSEFRDIVGEAYLVDYFDLQAGKPMYRLNWYTLEDEKQKSWFIVAWNGDPVGLLNHAIEKANTDTLYEAAGG